MGSGERVATRRAIRVAALAALSLVALPRLARALMGEHDDGIGRVNEVFTSQGCPKCPPADQLVTDLAREPRTIALTYAVDIWDFAGWRDTLASPDSTQRQRAYAAARGDRLVFTPQAIVDGVAVEPGADRAAILRDTRALGSSAALSVPLTLSESDGKLHIALGASTDKSRTATIYVLRVAGTRTVQIDRGANSGRSVTYTNVVRAISPLGTWTGAPQSFDVFELKANDEGYVVLLQAGTPEKPGPILAAAKTAGL